MVPHNHYKRQGNHHQWSHDSLIGAIEKGKAETCPKDSLQQLMVLLRLPYLEGRMEPEKRRTSFQNQRNLDDTGER